MDEDQRDLLRQLFVAATERLEAAHDAAIAGQSGEIAVEGYVEDADRLEAAARDIAALAAAMLVIACPGSKCARRSGPERRR